MDVHKVPQEAKHKGSSAPPDQCLASLSAASATLKQHEKSYDGTCPNVISCARGAQTFHTLPNGDVRVIQSPAQDIIVGAVVDAAQQVIENSISSLSSFKSSEFSNCELNQMTALAALKFDCSTEKLEKLIGVHFHLGELIVDTEMVSLSRGWAKGAEYAKAAESAKDVRSPCHATTDCGSTCFQGL